MQRLNTYVIRAFVVALLLAAIPLASRAQVSIGVGITIGPPSIPVYAQPACPQANYIWQPGYWAWGPGGYYWVPGTWVAPPEIGFLWTPGYWGWGGGYYRWHPGYWGRTVGFYGGINYGFGYYGNGYVGGRWYGNTFRYNTAITTINRTVIHNTYVDKTVVYQNNRNRTSFNGGNGGVQAHPTQGQIDARSHGQAPTTEQQNHEQTSSQDRNHLATYNHGQPAAPAVAHPYSSTNRPPHFTPVTDTDRQQAQQHVAPQGNKPPQNNHPPQNNNQQNGKPPR